MVLNMFLHVDGANSAESNTQKTQLQQDMFVHKTSNATKRIVGKLKNCKHIHLLRLQVYQETHTKKIEHYFRRGLYKAELA